MKRQELKLISDIHFWEKGTVMALQENDFRDGETFRVRLDSFAAGGIFWTDMCAGLKISVCPPEENLI